MTFWMPILIDDPDGGEHEDVAEISIGGPRDELDITATVGGQPYKLSEYWENVALEEARNCD